MKKSNTRAPTVMAGAIDEDAFLQAFEDVPSLGIVTKQETIGILKTVQETISDTTINCTRKQEALKKIRSLILAGANNSGDFHLLLKPLELPLQMTLKDLRSRVVHETCISVAFLAITLSSKFNKTAEFLFPQLINLIQSSARILATAGRTAVYFIIQATFNPRMITLLSSYALHSKSRDIRRSSYEFIYHILSKWPPQYLQRHSKVLQEALRVGIADADQNARGFSRKAFERFQIQFPARAKILLESLDEKYKKALLGDCSEFACSLQTYNSSSRKKLTYATDASRRGGTFAYSAIDLLDVHRAKSRTEYASLSRRKTTRTVNLLRQSTEGNIPRRQERQALSKNKNSESPIKLPEMTIHQSSEKLAGPMTRSSKPSRICSESTIPPYSEKPSGSKNRIIESPSTSSESTIDLSSEKSLRWKNPGRQSPRKLTERKPFVRKISTIKK